MIIQYNKQEDWKMLKETSSSVETKKLGRELAAKLKGGEVICLYGDLGAGKTVFVSGVMDYFLPKKRILSPTFIIVRHYGVDKRGIKNIYHVDLYRLSTPQEMIGLGIFDFIGKPENLVIIEWAEKLDRLLPDRRIDVKFEIIEEEKRKIEIKF